MGYTSSSTKISRIRFFSRKYIPAILLSFVLLIIIVIFFLPKSDIAAEVNGEKIKKSDYTTRLAAQTYFYTQINKSPEEKVKGLKDQVIEEMIEEILLTQLLSENKIWVTFEEIKERMEDTSVNRKFDGDWKKYESSLKTDYHTTLDETKRTFRLDILREKLVLLQQNKHLLAIWVAKNEPQFVSYESMQDDMKTRLEKANAPQRKKAENILKRIQNGEDFLKVAKETSEDPMASGNSGDLGFLFIPKTIGEPQPSLDSFPGKQAIFPALRELDVDQSKLYEVFSGYAIIKVTEATDGPSGIQSPASWYKSYRQSADVVIKI